EVVIGELVQPRRGIVEAVFRESALDRGERAPEAGADPAVRDRELQLARRTAGAARTTLCRMGCRDALRDEARRVPQLVAEIAVAADARELETDLAARGGKRRESEAQCVGAMWRNALRVLPTRRLVDGRRELRLHQSARALGDQ